MVVLNVTGNAGMLECQNAGMPECWNAGMLAGLARLARLECPLWEEEIKDGRESLYM